MSLRQRVHNCLRSSIIKQLIIHKCSQKHRAYTHTLALLVRTNWTTTLVEQTEQNALTPYWDKKASLWRRKRNWRGKNRFHTPKPNGASQGLSTNPTVDSVLRQQLTNNVRRQQDAKMTHQDVSCGATVWSQFSWLIKALKQCRTYTHFVFCFFSLLKPWSEIRSFFFTFKLNETNQITPTSSSSATLKTPSSCLWVTRQPWGESERWKHQQQPGGSRRVKMQINQWSDF